MARCCSKTDAIPAHSRDAFSEIPCTVKRYRFNLKESSLSSLPLPYWWGEVGGGRIAAPF
jgi:hypothetical protein